VKHPLDGPSSCTRTCRTLGHTLPVTRTTEERTHWCAAKVVGEMRCRGQRGGACAIKTRGKSIVSSRGFTERKESTSGGLELRLIDVEWRR
jgi:hypothetical protein